MGVPRARQSTYLQASDESCVEGTPTNGGERSALATTVAPAPVADQVHARPTPYAGLSGAILGTACVPERPTKGHPVGTAQMASSPLLSRVGARRRRLCSGDGDARK